MAFDAVHHLLHRAERCPKLKHFLVLQSLLYFTNPAILLLTHIGPLRHLHLPVQPFLPISCFCSLFSR